MVKIPEKQHAVQLVGPDQLVLNKLKDVHRPGPHQILAKVEVVGLCFSDLKLLKQFSGHVRKSEVVKGITPDVLKEIPSYVPGEAPTVPGHETVVRIVDVGPGVRDVHVGQRYLVQTDYRWARTSSSNAAFGYNFEGALQEYVLMDQRVITSPENESMLLAATEELSGSSIALAEPWACVEDAYVTPERRGVKTGGRMLVVVDAEIPGDILLSLLDAHGKPAEITWVPEDTAPEGLDVVAAPSLNKLPNEAFDDVVYFGSDAETIETIFAKIAANGLLNVVLCGGQFGRDIVTPVGRFHYGGIRLVGTSGCDPCESMKIIPADGEIRGGDVIDVIGAGGPMGMMHVIRNICQGVPGVAVYGGDLDDERLATLTRIAAPLATEHDVTFKTYNPEAAPMDRPSTYAIVMAPVPALVAGAIAGSDPHGIINIFAGIPATVTGTLNLDAYIEKQLYFIGTSGSTLEDMRRMLQKVESGRLNTDVSVAAVSGLDGAIEGIRAVEERSVAGKIAVYPACKGLGLVRLEQLGETLPGVAAKLKDGLWTVEAETALLEAYAT